MSYTTIHKVPESGEIEVAGEIGNAWRGAMNIWQQLYLRFLKPFDVPDKDALAYMYGNYQAIWDLAKSNSGLTENQRMVLMTTFDKAMVKRKDLPKVIAAFTDFEATFEAGSLPEQRQILEALASDESCYAVCWTQTSVADDIWRVYENDDARYYDVSKDTGHWFMFTDDE